MNGEVIKKDGSNVYINLTTQIIIIIIKTNFYGNVKINYENKEINCDNFNVDIEKNIANYNNVWFQVKSTMRASTIGWIINK